jgi:hypothetical protein
MESMMDDHGMTKGKKQPLPTRGFGAEPGVPDVPALAEWIAENRGRNADLITYRLDQSLAPQVLSEIGVPCAGGIFYRERVCNSMVGIEKNTVVCELGVNSGQLIADAAGMVKQKKGTWCALPAPHVLAIRDTYYNDEEEWNGAIAGAYRTMMRSMRDAGIAGHVLICETIKDVEISNLARQNVFFFQPKTDRESLECLMEHQRQVAVAKDYLKTVFSLTDEYDLQKICVIDPDSESVSLALSHLDPDQVSIGGYCTDACGEYWKNLVKTAHYTA